jgi:hypothetical protein
MKILASRRGRSVEPYDHHRGKLPLLRPTSRGRVSIFLTINFIGFVFANGFWLFVSSGRWVDFQPASYGLSIITPLGMSFLRPLSVLEHHGMIFVFGLLLAALMLVPLMTAVMYRLLYAIVMSVIIFALGHSPGLAIALALGSFLAARTPLRSDMPFLAFLLGLVPSAVYLGVMTFEGIEPAALPFERLLVKAPVLLALVAAVAGAAAVLMLARVMKYRPGVLWPVAAVLWIVPLCLFYAFEGPAWVRFHQLVHSPAMATMFDIPSRESADPAVGTVDSPEVVDEVLRVRRHELLEQCRRFLTRHGESEAAPAVAFLHAQAASAQLDQDAYNAGIVRVRSDHAAPASRPMWERLTMRYKHAPQSALARWRLAELDIAASQMELGLENLVEARRKLRAALAVEVKDKQPRPAAVTELQWPTRETYEAALARVDWLLWMMARHDLSDTATATVFARWMALDDVATGSLEYAAELERLIALDENGSLADDLRLAVAVRLPEADRAAALGSLAARPECGAWTAANYELGLLSLTRRASALPTHPDAATDESADGSLQTFRFVLDPPAVYFRRVLEAGDSPWQSGAQRWLAGLE